MEESQKSNINNNMTDKPLSTPKGDKYILEASINPFHKKNTNNKYSNFNFLESDEFSTIFKLDGKEIDYTYAQIQGKYKYIICILIKDDSYNSNILLERTLNGIKYNIDSLKQTFIEPNNILICLCFNEFKNFDVFDKEDTSTLKESNQFILLKKKYFIDKKNKETSIDVHCYGKLNFFFDVEILKFFYCFIVNRLRIENNIIFTSIMTAGVVPNCSTLRTLILLSYNSKDKHHIVVPLIDENDGDFLYQIKKYERVHFNLYNMNFYDMTASVPISSLLNVMTIDYNLFSYIKNYYQKININSSIDFHDYNLSLHLYRNNFKILYYNTETMGLNECLNNNEVPLGEYQEMWINRYSGYYGNFFEILKTFINFNNFNILKKVFMLFQIIGIFVEFIFPSLSTMVIYTIFYEAFNTFDKLPAVFCTLLYIFILICSGASSLITNRAEKMIITNLFFYFFFEIYYLFILICSVVAMDNVRKNKNLDPYKFNTSAIISIIILTVIPGICPMIFKSAVIFDNIIPMLLYLILGAPSSSSTFFMAKILNSSETCGGVKAKERKGIVIIMFFLLNLFFGSLTFFNYNRKKRVEAVMILGICYLIYNFFKVLAIVLNLLFNVKNLVISNKNSEELEKEFQLLKENMKMSRSEDTYQTTKVNQNQTTSKSDYFMGSINPFDEENSERNK